MIRVKATQRSELGRVTYANSITLTPGTLTLRIDGRHFVVHALTEAGADWVDQEVVRDGNVITLDVRGEKLGQRLAELFKDAG